MSGRTGGEMSRRGFVLRALGGSAAAIAGGRILGAQAPQDGNAQTRMAMHDSSMSGKDTDNLFAMDQMAAKPVRLPPKPNATPSMTDDQRDALEHRIKCQCGCTLDVYTCRTTDFNCRVSPAMHRDVMALVQGGYSAREIINAFVGVYGEEVLMAPPRSGFNLLAWFTPGLSVLAGGVVVAVLIRRWREPAPAAAGTTDAVAPLDATPRELAELEAAVRGDDRADRDR